MWIRAIFPKRKCRIRWCRFSKCFWSTRERQDNEQWTARFMGTPKLGALGPDLFLYRRETMNSKTTRTICFECHSRCGVLLEVKEWKLTGIKGDKDHPFSRGYICPKGQACMEIIHHRERITKPLVRVGDRESGKFESVSWDRALDIISERLLDIREKWGAEALTIGTGTTRGIPPFINRFLSLYGSPNYLAPANVSGGPVSIANSRKRKNSVYRSYTRVMRRTMDFQHHRDLERSIYIRKSLRRRAPHPCRFLENRRKVRWAPPTYIKNILWFWPPEAVILFTIIQPIETFLHYASYRLTRNLIFIRKPQASFKLKTVNGFGLQHQEAKWKSKFGLMKISIPRLYTRPMDIGMV